MGNLGCSSAPKDDRPKEEKQGEIRIIGSIDEIVRCFVKEVLLVWYDPKIESKENQKFIQEFKTICDTKTFSKWEEAAAYLKDIDIPFCQVITSEKDGELLVKEIAAVKSIFSIHVFCGNVEDHKQWTSQYPKIVSIDNEFAKLDENIKKQMMSWQRKESSLRVNLPAYLPIFDDMNKSENRHLHFYLKGFVDFQDRDQAKKHFLQLSKALYGKNRYIQEFEQNYNEYNMESILTWYTKECFLYRITNNSLRMATADSVQYCRLILHDLEVAIKEKYQQQSKNYSGLLYRGAFISSEEWTKICLNIGKEVEMLGFLSTSKEKDVALNFVNGEVDKKAFITIIVPAAPDRGEQGFAEMREYSKYQEEEEVLFNVMSLFTIVEARYEEIKGKQCRHLVLLYGAQAMRIYTDKKNPTIKISPQNLEHCVVCKVEAAVKQESMVFVNLSRTNEYTCKDCLQEYQANNKSALLCVPAPKYKEGLDFKIEGFVMDYQQDLDLPFYQSKCHRCQEDILKFRAQCSTCKEDTKVYYCEKCFIDDNNCNKEGHLLIIEKRPFSFWSEKVTQKELDYLDYNKSEFEAPELKMFKIAEVFARTHSYEKSSLYYQKFIRNTHDNFLKSVAYNNLGVIYSNMGDFQQAIECFSKCMELEKLSPIIGSRHETLAKSYFNIGSAYGDMGNHQKKIEFLLKTIDIAKTAYGEKHPTTATYYNSLGNSYISLGMIKEAQECYLKTLEIRKEVLGERHFDSAVVYNNLGNVHEKLGDYEKALEMRHKALGIMKTVVGDKHPNTAGCYGNLGTTYQSLGEYGKAIESLSKGLEIKRLVLGERHPDTAITYNQLGCVYYELGNCQKAIECHTKALEIRREALVDNHPDTAVSYNNLGMAYREMGNYTKAIELCSEGVKIMEVVLGKQHPSTIASHENLKTLHEEMCMN